MQDIELHDDRIQLRLVQLQTDLLHGHLDTRARVPHLGHRAVVAVSQLLQHLQIVHVDRKGRPVLELDA